MRAWVLLLLIPALAGCTQGDDVESDFEQTCPAWSKSPGQPGASVSTANYIGEDGQERRFNMEGDNIHHPPTGKYELYGGTLDVFEFTIQGRDKDGNPQTLVQNGSYVLRAYTTPQGTNAANHSDDERGSQLFFRDMSRSQGQQYLSELRIDERTGTAHPDVDGAYLFDNQTYRIELTIPPEEPEPQSLWIDYEFIDDDGKASTPAGGALRTSISFWYRTC